MTKAAQPVPPGKASHTHLLAVPATSPPSQAEQKYRKTNSQLDLRMRPKVHYFLQGGASQALCPKETGTDRTTQRRLSPWLPCCSGYACLTGISPQGKSAAHPPPAPEPAPTPQVPIHPQSRASGLVTAQSVLLTLPLRAVCPQAKTEVICVRCSEQMQTIAPVHVTADVPLGFPPVSW